MEYNEESFKYYGMAFKGQRQKFAKKVPRGDLHCFSTPFMAHIYTTIPQYFVNLLLSFAISTRQVPGTLNNPHTYRVSVDIIFSTTHHLKYHNHHGDHGIHV
jgi:hypothetical protein